MAIADDEKPEDYIFHTIPRSKRQAAARAAETRVTLTVKNAIQEYLSRYLSADGRYRDQLKQTAPYTIQYETGLSGSMDDPTVHEVQLARLWQDLRQKLPCIMIMDGKFEYHNPGLGGFTGSSWLTARTAKVDLKIEVSMELNIQVAALDETTCGDLRDMLVYILGPLTYVNKHLIRSDNAADDWEIRLPTNFDVLEMSGKKMPSDSHDSFYTAGVTLEVDFEGKVGIGFANQLQQIQIQEFHEGMIPNGFSGEDGSLTFATLSGYPDNSAIVVPEIVNLGVPAPIEAQWLPANARFTSEDPRMGLVNEDCEVISKRLGTFKLNLTDYGNGKPKTIRSWTIKVVPK